MGEVLVRIKIFPEDADHLEKVREKVKEIGPKKMEEEPLAFGLKALDAHFIIEDAEGGTENLENKLNNIKGVRRVEVASVRRTL